MTSNSSAPSKSDGASMVQVVPGGPVSGVATPPGSKSLTNRALICAAFAKSPSRLTGALRSEDTEVMIDSLSKIGVKIATSQGGTQIDVDPSGIVSSTDDLVEMFIANSGTSVRFLTAALSAFGGEFRLSGVPRMHERPIADLISAIENIIDGKISAVSTNGCPPVQIHGQGWSGSELSVAGNVSSQYLSGLMMAAPIAHSRRTVAQNVPQTIDRDEPIEIRVTGELVSRPYVEMTAEVMRSFGSQIDLVDASDQFQVIIDRSGYDGVQYAIEPDASAASYFWAIAAITGGTITVSGLNKNAMQGDVGFVDVLEKMGCSISHQHDSITVAGGPLRGIDIDMNAISDTVQTLSVVALFAEGPTRVRGVAHNRFKETDRIGDLATELRKLGAKVEEHEDGMTIHPVSDSELFSGTILETYHDHRMAMSLSLAGLKMPGVKILDPSCTGKTYPDFFHDLQRLIGRPHQWA